MAETKTRSRTKTASAQPSPEQAQQASPAPHAEERQRMIAEAAYYKAEQRAFAPGMETEDWLAADREGIAPEQSVGTPRNAGV
jgi:hypothetical protein